MWNQSSRFRWLLRFFGGNGNRGSCWFFHVFRIRFISGECSSFFFLGCKENILTICNSAMLCKAFCYVYESYTVAKYFIVSLCVAHDCGSYLMRLRYKLF